MVVKNFIYYPYINKLINMGTNELSDKKLSSNFIQNKEPISCPNCDGSIIIEQINCGIFRHAVMKNNFVQINPHLNQQMCEELINKKLIYGCGKPFQIIKNNSDYEIIKCDYI
jgi:hypothetical protein